MTGTGYLNDTKEGQDEMCDVMQELVDEKTLQLINASVSIYADEMSSKELNDKLEAGYADMQAGRVQDAGEAFRKFREEHKT